MGAQVGIYGNFGPGGVVVYEQDLYYTPEQFGAVGGLVDDTVAVQAAITAGAANRIPVFFKQDFFCNTLTLPQYSVLTGEKEGGVIALTVGGNILRFTGDDVIVEKITLQGLGHGAYVAGEDAINFNGSDRTTVKRVTIFNGGAAAIAGAYEDSVIEGCNIYDMADAGIYVGSDCRRNVVSKNIVHDVQYSGIDCNGNENRITENRCYNCGGGGADPASWAGILIWYVPVGAYDADHNIVSKNVCYNNVGCGIQVGNTSQAGGAAPFHPFGNIVSENICYGHTTIAGASLVPAGIAVYGSWGTIVAKNQSFNNYHNYAISGYAGLPIQGGVSIIDNKSLSAVVDGFHFSDDGGYVAPSGEALLDALIQGNSDRLAGRDSFRFDCANHYNMTGYRIENNHSYNATAYGFNATDAAHFLDYVFVNNYATSPGTAAFNNITPTFLANPDGYVGVGSLDPIHRLESRGISGKTLGALGAGNIASFDTEAEDTGVGGGIIFYGRYAGTTQVAGGMIKALKENNIDGHTGFHLGFASRTNGEGSVHERLSIASWGYVGVNKPFPNSFFAVAGLPSYANDAAAGVGGLTTGDFYLETGTNPLRVACKT